MKILMCTDLEGVSGVVSFEDQAFPDGKYYQQAKKLLTGEVNAAADGLLDAGADEVLVVDGHGCGGICFEEIHPRARLLHGPSKPPWAQMADIYGTCDATVMIGQHAMAQTQRGSLNHTQCSQTIEHYKLNGRPIGEIAQWALCCGAVGVPLIFLSGDRAACEEAEQLVPGITTAAVKEGLNQTSAISLAAPQARSMIRESIRQAAATQADNLVAPLVWDGPFVLEKRFVQPETAEAACANSNWRRVDERTVQLCAENILDIIYA